jgi:hypothetical protein
MLAEAYGIGDVVLMNGFPPLVGLLGPDASEEIRESRDVSVFEDTENGPLRLADVNIRGGDGITEDGDLIIGRQWHWAISFTVRDPRRADDPASSRIELHRFARSSLWATRPPDRAARSHGYRRDSKSAGAEGRCSRCRLVEERSAATPEQSGRAIAFDKGIRDSLDGSREVQGGIG